MESVTQVREKSNDSFKEYEFVGLDSTFLDSHFIFFIRAVDEKDTLKLFSFKFDDTNCENMILMHQKYQIRLDTLESIPIYNGKDSFRYFERGIVLSDKNNQNQLLIKAGEYIFTSPSLSGRCYLNKNQGY